MTSFRFLGFPRGSLVAMTLGNGPRTESVSVSEWGMTGSVEISVLSEQAIASAPFQINLEAKVDGLGVDAPAGPGDYDPQFHEIEYIWSVEKVGDASYASSTYSAVPELPDFMRVKGTKYGKAITHVIGKGDVASGSPATFRFTCTAINLETGESATSTVLERNVSHPDDAFSAAETFVIRQSTATNYPATSNPLYSTRSAAFSAILNASGITKARMCYERGMTDAGKIEGKPDNEDLNAILYDTWGDSGDVILANDNAGTLRLLGANSRHYASLQYDGFTIDGSIRALTAHGDADTSLDIVVTVSDLVLRNVSVGAERVGGVGVGWVAFNNMKNTDYSYCGALTFLSDTAKGLSYIGCTVSDNPAASSDNVKPGESKAGGGGWAMRINTAPHFYVSNSLFFTKQGWFVNTPGISTTQPNWRLSVMDGHRCQFSQCLFEGSGQSILRLDEDTPTTGIANTLIHRCFFASAYGLQQFIENSNPLTLRNNVFVMGPGRSPTVYQNLERVCSNDGPAGTDAIRIYNNTLINLQGGSSAAIVAPSGSRPLIEANNVLHQAYKDTPQSAGTFTLSEIYDTKQDGYDTLADGQDPVYVCITSVSSPFTVGETVTGSVSGVSKTYVGTRDRFRDEGMLAFQMPVIYDNLTAAGIARFASNDVLTGSLGGAATMDSMYSSQPHDTAMFAVGTIPFTIMPTHLLAYEALTGNFTEGDTLTGGTSGATGTICQVFDDGTTGLIWLRGVTGTFVDNETLADGSGGSARADGDMRSAGTGALWLPAEGNPALGAALHDPVALFDFFGNRRPAYPSKGAFEAAF